MDQADVSLRVPADGAYVSVLRTMTASLAARLCLDGRHARILARDQRPRDHLPPIGDGIIPMG